MGNFLSCDPSAKNGFNNGETVPADFSQSPPPRRKRPHGSIKISPARSNLDTPPPYAKSEGAWAQQLLSALTEAQNQGWLKSLPARHYHLYVDDNYRLPVETIQSMQLFACCIVLILRALKVDATLYFTNFRDLEQLPEHKKRRELYLDELFTCKNWYDAEKHVNESANIENSDQEMRWMTEHQDDEHRFLKLLQHLRQKRRERWDGWPLRDLASEDVLKHCNDAFQFSEKQPQLLNSLAFTLVNAIQGINSLYESGTTAPTSVLILSASQLQESELNKLKSALGNVMGGAKEFSITVLAFAGELDTGTLRALRTLDQYKSDTEDIIDIITVQELLLFEKGPSARLLAKLFNGHDRNWDKENLNNDQLYGKGQIVLDEIQLPSLEDVMQAVKAA